MANSQQGWMVWELADAETPAAVQAAACRIVAKLLFEGRTAFRPAIGTTDSEWADRLVDCELGLIADGEDPLRIALWIAVLKTARQALRACAGISALPGSDNQGHRT